MIDDSKKDLYESYKPHNNLDDIIKYNMNNWFSKLLTITSNGLVNLDSKDPCDFYRNNPNSTPTLLTLCIMNQKGIAVWLSTKGEFCYRLTPNDETIISSISNAEYILSSCLPDCIIIGKKQYNNQSKKKKNINLCTSNLLLVDSVKFDPYQKDEFFDYKKTNMHKSINLDDIIHNRNITYINSYKPSLYLRFVPQKEEYEKIKPSIILQYLYHLANYKKDRFHYILNWIASFFKDLKNRSKISLVLIGKKNSGKELFFDEILTPLFGRKYCMKITNYNLHINNHLLLIKEKLFYCLSDLSTQSVSNQRNQHFLKNLTNENGVFFERNNSIEEVMLYGQLLITSNDFEIPYLDSEKDNYTIFNVPNNIKEIHIPNSMAVNNKILKDLIKDDLENFALILKFHKIDSIQSQQCFKDDDKQLLSETLEIKLQNFHNNICTKTGQKSLLQKIDQDFALELKNDFKENKIKQKNLHPLFIKLNPNENISNRKLIKLLRDVLQEKCYNQDVLENGKFGKKYIILN